MSGADPLTINNDASALTGMSDPLCGRVVFVKK